MSAATAELVIPSHVPSERVRLFDIYNAAPGARDLMDSATQLLEDDTKIFYTPLNGGHWVVAGYEAAAQAARDTQSFSNRPYTIPTYPDEPPLFPLFVDPPVHTVYRAVLANIFTPKSATALKDNIRNSAVNLIEQLPAGQGCDFVTAFAELLPVSVFLNLLGLPLEKLSVYRDAVKTYLGASAIEDKMRAATWLTEELSQAIRDRQAEPRDDVISDLIRATVEGRTTTFDEVLNLCMMIFLAGLDTVTVSLSYGMRYLAEDQEMQRWARSQDGKLQDLIEELLRRFSAAQPGRTIAADTEIDGVVMKRGDRVFVCLAAADLDSDIFDNPLSVDPHRPKKPHLAFNVGPHRCVGMHLARTELLIAYQEWLARIPQFRVAGTGENSSSGGHVFSIDHLHLCWD